MLAESSRLFQLLGILQLLNTFSISSFLNTGIDHGINYDSACTAFDNALVTIKKKVGHFLCYFAGNFPHKDSLCSALGRTLAFCIKSVPRHPTCSTATVKCLTLGDKPTKEIRSQTRNVAKRNNISNKKIFISEVYPKLNPIKNHFLWCRFTLLKHP